MAESPDTSGAATTEEPGRIDDVDAAVEGYRHGRVPKEVRRRHLLELAEALFAEKGYSAASMDELARRAGVSKPVIYESVGNKEELFRACMSVVADEMATRVSDAAKAVEDPRESMFAGIEAWFTFISQHRDIWDGLLSGEDLPVSSEVSILRKRQARLVADLLRGGAASSGRHREQPEPGAGLSGDVFGALAHLINGACESLAIWWREHPSVTASELAHLCTVVLFPGLAGLAEAAAARRDAGAGPAGGRPTSNGPAGGGPTSNGPTGGGSGHAEGA